MAYKNSFYLLNYWFNKWNKIFLNVLNIEAQKQKFQTFEFVGNQGRLVSNPKASRYVLYFSATWNSLWVQRYIARDLNFMNSRRKFSNFRDSNFWLHWCVCDELSLCGDAFTYVATRPLIINGLLRYMHYARGKSNSWTRATNCLQTHFYS